MKIELKNVHYSPSLSEETSAFTADIYVNGKKSGYARNNGHGGSTNVSPYGGVNRDLFVECENWLLGQPEINIGSEQKPFMVKSNMENVVDQLFEKYLKDRDQKKLEKKMETCLIWGLPNGTFYHVVNYKRKLTDIPHDVLQSHINHYKKDFKDGEVYLNTNLVGFNL